MSAVVDRSGWPVVAVSVVEPGDLDALASELELLLGEERPFALVVRAPRRLDALHEMLWDAPAARRRLRRLRSRLAAWCEATVHVLPAAEFDRTAPSQLRTAELIWGCAALSARTDQEASALLLDRLAERPVAQAV